MLYMSDWEINRSKVVVYIKMYNKDIGMHRMHEDSFCEPQLISISIILTDCLPLSHNGTLSVALVQHRQVCQPLWYVWNLKKYIKNTEGLGQWHHLLVKLKKMQ